MLKMKKSTYYNYKELLEKANTIYCVRVVSRTRRYKMEITKIERVALILLVESKIGDLKTRLLRERDGIAQTYIENDIAFYNALRDKLKDYE